MTLNLSSFYNIDEFGLQGSTSDEEAIDIGLDGYKKYFVR